MANKFFLSGFVSGMRLRSAASGNDARKENTSLTRFEYRLSGS